MIQMGPRLYDINNREESKSCDDRNEIIEVHSVILSLAFELSLRFRRSYATNLKCLMRYSPDWDTPSSIELRYMFSRSTPVKQGRLFLALMQTLSPSLESDYCSLEMQVDVGYYPS